MNTRLAAAIQLRENGRAQQDQAILEEARQLLLALHVDFPDEPEVTCQLAIVHDNLGLERDSIPFYLQTLARRIPGPDIATKLMKLERAYLGLGSTYRVLGEYQASEDILRQGVGEFPESRALQVFLAMVLYNVGKHKEAMELVLTNLMETTSDEALQYYQRGLLFYASHLDETWE